MNSSPHGYPDGCGRPEAHFQAMQNGAAGYPCQYEARRGSLRGGPGECCPNDAEPGSEYCLEHLPVDPGAERDTLLDGEAS